MFDMDQLPNEALEYIIRLRKEAAQYRDQRNTARKQLAELRDEWEQLSADAADLWRGTNPRSGEPLRVSHG
ncbi:hypothetical protein [Rhodococcus sp. A14]|uniref:hypothetical protein n=1 Tax=Rhodococcus sp. A14 TaxID=1194106 RepID=UPI00141EC2B9|nr:hypothetical protein [Rhodococcus sp. A14]